MNKLNEAQLSRLQYSFGVCTGVFEAMTLEEMAASIERAPSLRVWVAEQIALEQDQMDGDRSWHLVWEDVERIECENDVFTIVARNEMVPVITKKIATLNKRAAKLGCKPIELVVGPAVEEEVEKRDAFGEPVTVKYLVNEVSVHGASPKLEGWELVAVVDHTDSGNIFRRFPGMDEVNLEAYRTVGRMCEHCNKARMRKDTVILRNVETGELKMVGKTCLKDFTGHMHPTQVLTMYSQLRSWLDELVADHTGPKIREEDQISLHWFLSWTASYVRVDGWVSRTRAKGDITLRATADEVLEFLSPPISDKDKYEKDQERKRLDQNQADIELAEAAEKWAAMELKPRSDYDYSIQAIAKNGYTTARQAGYAGSILTAYMRHLDREYQNKKQAESSNSKHQGQIKERITRTVTLSGHRIIECDNGYGPSSLDLFEMQDAEGNVYIWFTGSGMTYRDVEQDWERPVQLGMTVEVKMTVKDHAVYKGVAQTKVNRLSVLRVVSKESVA